MSEQGKEQSGAVRPRRKRQRRRSSSKPKRLPPYHVILLDDDDHTYGYVIDMLGKLFRYPAEKGQQLAEEVDRTGRVILLTTTKEHAELKQEQIHAFGADFRLDRSAGSMSARIEPAN
jgi:ATP-dependent Clp protease adaptor protein ClpS